MNTWKDSYSWISSTYYHINCSKPQTQTVDWSPLNPILINKICKPRRTVSLEKNIKKIVLQPPNKDNEYSKLYTLEISLQSTQILCLENGGYYGYLQFITRCDNCRSNRESIVFVNKSNFTLENVQM